MISHPEPTREINPPRRGVYCLANDQALEWFQVFARSLRHFNPALPLTIIPYNGEVTRLRQLAPQFNFDILPEAEVSRFDALETRIMKLGSHAAMFRKWAGFFGPYEEFMFFDADIAITLPLEIIFNAFAGSDYDFVYFDTDITKVYRPECIAEMQSIYHSPGFNAGAFVSRKGVITETELWQMADRAVADYHRLKPDQVDQPFLNYVFDTLPRRIAHVNTLRPELALKPWARVPFHYDARRDRMLDADGRELPFIHWAGCHHPTMVRPEIYLKYRTLGLGLAERTGYRLDFYRRRYNRQFRSRVKQAMRNLKPET